MSYGDPPFGMHSNLNPTHKEKDLTRYHQAYHFDLTNLMNMVKIAIFSQADYFDMHIEGSKNQRSS
jgi:hypothetical protein